MTTSVAVPLNRLVSVADYAKEKGVSKQTIYNWIATNEVKHQKVGKSFLVIR